MISVDAMSGEIYLELKPNSKTEDVAQYFIDLCKDMHKDNVDKLFIALDNNSTHKKKDEKAIERASASLRTSG